MGQHGQRLRTEVHLLVLIWHIYIVFRMDYRTVGLSDCQTIGLSDYSYGPIISRVYLILGYLMFI